MTIKHISLVAFSAIFTFTAEAKTFRNQYVEFELPAGWDCKLEKSEWVCQSKDPAIRKEIIVICAAKPRGPDDTIQKYKTHLQQPRPKTDLTGKEYNSKIVFVKEQEIKGQPWVDGMHLGSEIPGFYTRYLATIKGKVAMLLTWSVAKTAYKKHLDDMDNFVRSLYALDDVSTTTIPDSFGANSPFGADGSQDMAGGPPPTLGDKVKALTNTKAGRQQLFIFLGILLAVVIFIILRRRTRKK